jgi:spermidine synthase
MSGAHTRAKHLLLLASTFVIAVCGLVYELLVGTVSSYLLGDSVYQFSLVIGLFMSAMGLGSFLSRFIRRDLERSFVRLQIGVGLIGGLAPLLLFNAFAYLDNYTPFLLLACILAGTLVGAEIPLVVRMLERLRELKINISNVLTADYIGALAASLLFPLVLVPQLGLLRTGLLFGLLNLAVAGLAVAVFRAERPALARSWIGVGVAAVLLSGLFVWAPNATALFEDRLYRDEIVHAEDSPYQRILITRNGKRLRLFLNGALQLDSLDEYRYHEALVHPAMALADHREQVLVLGGGDGMAVREVLRFPGVKEVTLVDLDPRVTGLFTDHPLLAPLNRHALSDSRVRVINQDAGKFLEQTERLYDLIVLDLPDPRALALSRLYTRGFYRLATSRLAAQGRLVTQATSPLFARRAFYCIQATLQAASPDLQTLPYHAYIPSFGDWGFVLASRAHIPWHRIHPLPDARFATADTLAAMPRFPPDMGPVDVRVNTLVDHPLVRYYDAGWSRWYE